MTSVPHLNISMLLPKSATLTPPSTPPGCPWYEVARDKQAQRETQLAKRQQWRLAGSDVPSPLLKDVSHLMTSKLSSLERLIVESDATTIVRQIRERSWTAVEVLTAFCKVAVVAQDLTNCLTEIFIDQGMARAKELDDHLERTGQVVGPLHGLPVSIKDHILIRGLDTSTGYIAWANETVAEKDAVVVDILRQAGAVLYVKTANPQTLLCLETNNNVYGRTVNPFNRDLSPGGSSGGESTLIAAHGSPLGVGTDIGGSIRIPAAFTGLYGFKGSVARMPHAGLLGSHDGMDNIVGCVGPIARSARDLELFCRVMMQYEAWLLEHAVLEIPWNTEVAQGKTLPSKLSFAILWDDGVVKPHPPVTRELQRTKEALLKAGHEVIDWIPSEHQEGWDLISKLYLQDGGAEYRQTMAGSGEPAVPGTEWILNQPAVPSEPYSIPDTWKLNIEREQFRARGLQHWNATKSRTSTGRPIDAVICPAHPTLAVPHDGIRWWGYTSHWNMLDLPGAVFPSGDGRFDASEFTQGGAHFDAAYGKTVPRSPMEKDVFEQWETPETYQGAPIALQIVGRRHNEEKVLAMLDVLERATGRVKDSESD